MVEFSVLLYYFSRIYVIMTLRFIPAHFMGREVNTMVHIFAILKSVVADVISHYICKWLDSTDQNRKPN